MSVSVLYVELNVVVIRHEAPQDVGEDEYYDKDGKRDLLPFPCPQSDTIVIVKTSSSCLPKAII